MTIEVAFHLSGYRNFKTFYLELVSCYWKEAVLVRVPLRRKTTRGRTAFPNLVSYNRFFEWQPSTLIPLMAYLRSRLGTSTGIGFVDSTSIKVCQHGGCTSWGNPSIPHRHNRRIKQHRVFEVIATRGKTSVDWFCGATPLGFPQHGNAHQDGFKLHLAINHGSVAKRRDKGKKSRLTLD